MNTAGQQRHSWPLTLAWAALLIAPAPMAVGHLQEPALSWIRHPISTYAASRAGGPWVTTGMGISIVAIACLGVALAARPPGGKSLLAILAAMAFAVSAAGVCELALYPETGPAMTDAGRQLRALAWQQGRHDAGVQLFFNGSIAALGLSGLLLTLGRDSRLSAACGAAAGISIAAASVAAATAWPGLLGIPHAFGLQQRAAYFALWCGAISVVIGLTAAARRPAS